MYAIRTNRWRARLRFEPGPTPYEGISGIRIPVSEGERQSPLETKTPHWTCPSCILTCLVCLTSRPDISLHARRPANPRGRGSVMLQAYHRLRADYRTQIEELHRTHSNHWSGRPDLNRRPLPPQGSALPPALRPDATHYNRKWGNAERTRSRSGGGTVKADPRRREQSSEGVTSGWLRVSWTTAVSVRAVHPLTSSSRRPTRPDSPGSTWQRRRCR